MKYLSRSGCFKSGNPRYYYREPGFKSIPMPDAPIDSPVFLQWYEKMSAGPARSDARFPDIAKELRSAVKRSRERSARRGRTHTVTEEIALQMLWSQRGKCALTGITFTLSPSATSKRKPFAPSIDRLDPTRGYEPDNVRLVCVIVNLARGDFSDSELLAMANGLTGTKRSNLFFQGPRIGSQTIE